MKKNNKKGFTIVELVIVIAVIAILAAVLIPTFSSAVKKANESAALQEARNAMTNDLVLAESDYDNIHYSESKTAGNSSVTLASGESYKGYVDVDENATKYTYANEKYTCEFVIATGVWTVTAKTN